MAKLEGRHDARAGVRAVCRSTTKTRSISSTAKRWSRPCATSRASSTRRTRSSGASWGCCTTWTGKSTTTNPRSTRVYAARDIEAAGGTPELVRAIQSHTSDFNPALPKPELQMEKILFATEELTGLIGAAIVMRPSKSVMDFEVKSLKKKFKDKRFAAGVSRDVIRTRRRHAGLGAGRAVRPHHRGHAVLRSRSRHLQACGSIVPQASGRRSSHTARG